MNKKPTRAFIWIYLGTTCALLVLALVYLVLGGKPLFGALHPASYFGALAAFWFCLTLSQESSYKYRVQTWRIREETFQQIEKMMRNR